MNAAQATSQHASAAASEAAAELAAQTAMVGAAKARLQAIEHQLHLARIDFEAAQNANYDAAHYAQVAQNNAAAAAAHAAHVANHQYHHEHDGHQHGHDGHHHGHGHDGHHHGHDGHHNGHDGHHHGHDGHHHHHHGKHHESHGDHDHHESVVVPVSTNLEIKTESQATDTNEITNEIGQSLPLIIPGESKVVVAKIEKEEYDADDSYPY